ncbi:MAG: Ig-like domain-containing protein, partial [Candidatus Neomarinimicrobiota bacterium]|nr:Ig-like domain-containing protein [Candidatus Neomarinimicrobiota bacterium]
MIEHIRSYFIIACAFVLFITAGRAENVQAVNDNIMLKEDEAKIIDVLKNDKLDSRDNLDLIILSKPSLGTAELQGFNISFIPNANVSGTDEFQYSIDDGFSSDTAKIKITIVPMNDVPISVDLFNNSVVENGADVALIGELSTTDPDLDDSFNYSFSDKGE